MTSKAKKGKRLVLAKGLRFSCQQCGDCCRSTPVTLTPEEVLRYNERDWTELLGVPGPITRTVRRGGAVTTYLQRRADGSCVFLQDDNSCSMHTRYGAEDKPLVCRSYPFQFFTGGERPLVSAEFGCSSIASGDGERVLPRDADLAKVLEEAEAVNVASTVPETVPFLYRIDYPRADVEMLLELMVKELEGAHTPFPSRLLVVAKFISLVASSRFASLDSKTTRKQVQSFAKGIRAQVERDLLKPPAHRPRLPQRLMFRLLLAFAARQDNVRLLTAGPIRRAFARIGNLLAGLTFMAGTGAVKPVGRSGRVVLGEVRRRAPVADPTDPIADGALTRYFVAKLSGGFLYDSEFRMRHALPSLGLLLRQYPMILLFARAACWERQGESLSREDYASALRSVDASFGRIGWDQGLLGPMRAGLLSEVEEAFALVPWCAGQPAAAPAGAPGS